jgi:hypothetical protein
MATLCNFTPAAKVVTSETAARVVATAARLTTTNRDDYYCSTAGAAVRLRAVDHLSALRPHLLQPQRRGALLRRFRESSRGDVRRQIC